MDADNRRRSDDGLSGRVSALESDMRALAHSFDSFAKRMETAVGNLSSRQRTPWGVLAAWASVFLMFGGMFAGMYLKDYTNLETRLQRAENRLWDRAQADITYYRGREK